MCTVTEHNGHTQLRRPAGWKEKIWHFCRTIAGDALSRVRLFIRSWVARLFSTLFARAAKVETRSYAARYYFALYCDPSDVGTCYRFTRKIQSNRSAYFAITHYARTRFPLWTLVSVVAYRWKSVGEVNCPCPLHKQSCNRPDSRRSFGALERPPSPFFFFFPITTIISSTTVAAADINHRNGRRIMCDIYELIIIVFPSPS